jgi:hypothetical protein
VRPSANTGLFVLTIYHSLGVPYHSWRITHAKHHASTGHMTQDQVWVPPTRSQKGLPPLNPAREDRLGARASEEVKKELWEALGDSPIGASCGVAMYLVSACVLFCWPILISRTAFRLASVYPHQCRGTAPLPQRHQPCVAAASFVAF